MRVNGRRGRSRSTPSRHRNRAVHVARAALAAAAVTTALLVLLAPAAQAQPLQLTVTVVPPSGASAPRPTGGVTVSIDGRRLLSVPLVPGIAPLTSITPQLSAALDVLGHRVTIRYSGDSNYEASTGISVTLPTRRLLTIVARPNDTAAPAIEILSPRDGARYALGEAVVAAYSCRDPGDRSAVTACDGSVASASAVYTASDGTFSFVVRSADALGNATSKTVTYEVGAAAGGPAATTGSTNSGSSTPPAPPPAVAPPAGTPVRPAVPAPPGAVPRRGAVPPSPAAPARSSLPHRPGSSPPRSSPNPRTAPAPLAGASHGVTRSVQQVLAPYDPRADPAKTLAILVAAFTLLQVGVGAAGVVRARPRSRPKPEFGYDRLRVTFLGAGLGAVAIGDRSRTWSWPGTQRLDALSAALPARLARRTPLLARVAADGTYLRAILGSASLLGLLAGVALGVAAVSDTGGEALPPAAALTIAIAVLGVLDAAAGLAAVLIFTLGVVVLGGVQASADLRVVLSLAVLWFVVPVLVGAVRPLRRPPTHSFGQSWDRAADVVIASLVGAWTVYQILRALPGLAGMELPIARHAATAAFCVLAALVVRLAAETVAAHLYPRRLDIAEPIEVPQPGRFQLLAASALRTAIFVFFGYIVAGTSWQLWLGAALFVVPQILAVYKDRFPNSRLLFRARPRGLVRIVLLLSVGTAIAALLLHTMNAHSTTFLADSFVILVLPGFLLALIPVFGRDGERAPIGWGKRIAGIAILAAGIALVLTRL
jgi:hypothetical protein